MGPSTLSTRALGFLSTPAVAQPANAFRALSASHVYLSQNNRHLDDRNSGSLPNRLPPGLTAYPNPAANTIGFLYQGLPLLSGLLRICDATGRIVMERSLDDAGVELDELANGSYRAVVRNRAGRVLSVLPVVIAR